MATVPNSVKGADAATSGNSTLTNITNTQSVTSAAPTAPADKTRALTGRQYDRVYGAKESSSAAVPGEKTAAKSGGGDDFFSGIGRAITSAVNVAMAVVNPLSAVAGVADTIAKVTNKKA